MSKNFRTYQKEVGDFVFENLYWETKSDFRHSSTLKRKDNPTILGYGERKYYNRTWESYPFQSVMLKTVDNALLNIKQQLEDDYRRQVGLCEDCEIDEQGFDLFTSSYTLVILLTNLRKEIKSSLS